MIHSKYKQNVRNKKSSCQESSVNPVPFEGGEGGVPTYYKIYEKFGRGEIQKSAKKTGRDLWRILHLYLRFIKMPL